MNKRYLREKSILYLFKVIITLLITGSMFLVWFFCYNPNINLPFYAKGHYLMVAVFMVIYLVFTKVYGAFMVGTASVIDLIFSQIIAVGFTVGSSYAIFTLLSYKLVNPVPLIIFFFVFSVVAIHMWHEHITGVHTLERRSHRVPVGCLDLHVHKSLVVLQ